MADAGNPNFFSTFKGRYAVSAPDPSEPDPHVMLSCVNDVQFMCDFTADDTGLLCVLPEDCRPKREVRMFAMNKTTNEGEFVTVGANGNVTGKSVESYRMNGLSFHISDNWYI